MTDLQIEAFLSICRHKSISKAAEELFISQSSLSTRLKTLEESLGCPLLLRSKGSREIVLTAQGQAFYALALQHQEIIRQMEDIRKTAVTGLLRVSAINSINTYTLPSVYKRFSKNYPDVHLQIQDMEAEMAVHSLVRGYTDIAFSTAKIQTDHIVSIPFLSDPLVLICPDHAVYPEKVDLDMLDVKNEVYIRLCADQEYWHDITFGGKAEPQIRLEMIEQIRLFMSEPTDWAIVPRSIADHLTQAPGVRQCEPSFYIPNRNVFILRNKANAEADIIHRFLDTVREVLTESHTMGLLL
ncbi:MAG: LysR family transcriptional regulator [Clostridia bacterium]|nr:LysR family transcriptional regulator [Clostridia bacterium]